MTSLRNRLMATLRTDFPYCIADIKKGKSVFLNREYKPLGGDKEVWYEYEEWSIPYTILSTQADSVSYTGKKEEKDWIYLYNDGCPPWASEKDLRNYLFRLAVVLKTLVDPIR